MSEEGGYGVAADAAESAARQSGIQLIPDPRSDLHLHSSASSPITIKNQVACLKSPFCIFAYHVSTIASSSLERRRVIERLTML